VILDRLIVLRPLGAPFVALVLAGQPFAALAQPTTLPPPISPEQALARAVRADAGPEVRLSLTPEAAAALALRRAGIARTSVDRRLAGDDLLGSFGFLCGLQPGAGRSGAAAARGVDPTGRFLGAKLSLAFR
jgi:hypothetical protein